ncbi:MAG: carboxypeptidase-like regulatory domain-containing protein [Planctomycetota bacterium]
MMPSPRSPIARMLRPLPALFVCIAAPLLAAGCNTPKLDGLVIPGPTPFVAALNRDEPKTDTSGIPGAKVRVTLASSGQLIADTETDEFGRFSVDTPGERMARGAVRVVATADGYTRVSRTTSLQTFEKMLLISMTPLPGAGPASGDAPEGDPADDGAGGGGADGGGER